MHLDRGDDVNARDSNGMTPLMLAASKNKAAICALLLSRGADLGLADSHGRDALALARAAGASDAVTAMELFAPRLIWR
jgi:RNA polymerase primary sigma factor